MYGTGGNQVSMVWCDYLTIGAWFICSYLYHGLGVTMGYHRLLAHRSLVLPKYLEYIVVLGGYFALQGSPVVWVGVHRLHHWKADIKGDPHSPRDGFLHALIGWMFQMYRLQANDELQTQARDVMQDVLYRLLGTKHTADHVVKCLVICAAFRFGILYAFGPSAATANLVAMFMIFWSAQLVNAACHTGGRVGYRSFATNDSSCNFWLFGILALGEGWHNNHHAAPMLARHGRRPFELDATWRIISLLEMAGIARDVRKEADFS